MKRLLLFLSFFASMQTHAVQIVNLKKFSDQRVQELGLQGYQTIVSLSFKDNKDDYTSTTLSKSDDIDGPGSAYYMVGVGRNLSTNKINIFIRYPASICKLQGKPILKSLYINEQAVEMVGTCVTYPGETKHVWVFAPKNPQGNSFVYNAFSSQEMVMFVINGVTVPFETEGFTEVYQKISSSM